MSVELTEVLAELLPVLHARVEADLSFWTKEELYAWLDEELKKLARKGVFIVKNSITIVAGTATYSTPTRHVSTLHVAFNNKALRDATTDVLEAGDPSYQTTPGTPTHWYPDRIGFNKIGLWPVPNAAAILLASTVEVIYHEYPAAPDGFGTVSIPVPSPVADAMEVGVLIEAYAKVSDSMCPEISGHLRELMKLENEVMESLWGTR